MNFNIVLTAVGILTAVSAGLSIIISVADKVLNNYGICELDINDGEKKLSVTGGSTCEGLSENFRVQASGLMAGGADYLPPGTCQDTRSVKAGLAGNEAAFAAAGGALGKPHFARVMVRRGYAGSVEEVFERYLVDGRPGDGSASSRTVSVPSPTVWSASAGT